VILELSQVTFTEIAHEFSVESTVVVSVVSELEG